ncbi:DoxX family protein [Flavimaricola marinus]|uniref:DoxX n=1 Tax=Flavimaricola marinus TaxID=1819565 RepID=A0A238LHR6_9RHOB|nr:DoxX family protein [Flavimaricola marinus]SMY08420.1 DoxX [Flavimaricola marinus]
MTYLSIGLRVLLTLAFVAAGFAKLSGVEMMVATYDAIGVGQWFRYLTGIIEIGGAVLLWLPRRQVLAAGLLGATMVGAVLAHLFILGPSAVPAVILGLISAAVIYLHRDQIDETLGRTA